MLTVEEEPQAPPMPIPKTKKKSPWSLRIGRLAGIDISVHATFLFLPLFYVEDPRTLFLLVSICACVILHELGHAITAAAFGVRTTGIVLLPIGGVAILEEIPKRPFREFFIALGGPLVNFVLAGVFFATLESLQRVNGVLEIFDLNILGGSLLESLLFANILMGAFNLIPALPMDGGRMLRAILAWKLSYVDATILAAGLGRVLGVVTACAAFVPAYPLMLLPIGAFIYFIACAEARVVREEFAPPSDDPFDDLKDVDTESLREHLDDMITRTEVLLRKSREGKRERSPEVHVKRPVKRKKRRKDPGVRDVKFDSKD